MIPKLSKNLKHLWLIDIDGVTLKHNGYLRNGDEVLPGVKEFWDTIPEKDVIILLSARNEKYLDSTLNIFHTNNLRFDQAIFGLPHGERILINDIKPNEKLKTALAFNIVRNKGFDEETFNADIEVVNPPKISQKALNKAAKAESNARRAEAAAKKMEEAARRIEEGEIEIDIDNLKYAELYKDLFKDIVEYTKNIKDDNKFNQLVNKISSVHSETQLVGLSEPEDVTANARRKGITVDPIVENFILGAAGRIGTWDGDADNINNPIALRSIAKRKQMKACLETGRDFYYIDTGYFGNGKSKKYHRVTRNAMQWLGEIEDRPSDRWEETGEKLKKHTPGSKILICPPSQKALKYWDIDLSEWLEETINNIRNNTDREIIIRTKPTRTERITTNTMEQALADDVHCMVTFNSIAAVESLMNGKPVFTMGPNAAHHLSNQDLSNIENPFMPDQDQVYNLVKCLAYHQFTVPELRNGFAWAMLNGKA
jgi:hypothetical protein